MQDRSTIPTCSKGHPLTPENLRQAPSWKRPRCRLCENAAKTNYRTSDPDGARARATALRRETRAKMKEEDPERYAKILERSRERKRIREQELSPAELTVQWQRKKELRDRQAQIQREAKALNVTISEYNAVLAENALAVDELVRDQNRPSAAWNLLKVKGDALPVWEEFSLHLETTVTPCQGSDDWTNYDDPRPGRDDERGFNPMPTRSQAKAMCNSCPLIDLCAGFAQKDKPDFGVWGGERWLGGKRVQ